jgi:hypothetical protein
MVSRSNLLLLLLVFGSYLSLLVFVYLLYILVFLIFSIILDNIRIEKFLSLDKIMLLLFVISFFITVILNSTYEFTYTKIYRYCYLLVLPLLFLSLISYEKLSSNYKLVIQQFFIAAVLLLLLVISSLSIKGAIYMPGNKLTAYGFENSIWFARFLAIMFFIILFYLVKVNTNFMIFFLSLILLIISFILIIKSGSRGALLSLFFSSVYLLYKESKYTKILLFLGFILAPFTLSGIIYYFYNMNVWSMAERLSHYQLAYNHFTVYLFGSGVASYAFFQNGDIFYNYPHNIFVEVYFELGAVGLTFLLLFLTLVFRASKKNDIFFYLFLMALFNALFSGDVISNGQLFIFGYLVCRFYKLNTI